MHPPIEKIAKQRKQKPTNQQTNLEYCLPAFII